MKRSIKIGVILVSVIIILLIIFLIINKTGVINRIIENSKQEEVKKEISYEVYHHVNGDTKILVVAEDTENGIEKIIYPNNEMELYCNGKTKVAFDYNTDVTGKESLTFKMVNTIGEEIEKTIEINDDFYAKLINNELITETETQKALRINYKQGSTVAQYRVGDNSPWINYGGTIRLDDYQILETLGQENRNVKISLRQVDNIGNEIITDINHNINDNIVYKQEDRVIQGESILACVENNNLESGNYIFRVTGKVEGANEETIEYPVELYNYNEDANYVGQNNILIGDTWYTGIGKLNSEKRMLILKYNKNLTIENSGIITPTGTNENINGTTYLSTKKGMLIYCAGTLTNNGQITMTAKGTVNQVGENVYLYKNEDNSYEYIPAVGASGGVAIIANNSSWYSHGTSGSSGTIRKTGGGGAGAAQQNFSGTTNISGAGSSGTAYSGGTGGGGIFANGGTAGSGQSNGGIGGSGYGIGNIAASRGRSWKSRRNKSSNWW